jgi:hypothetical protein
MVWGDMVRLSSSSPAVVQCATFLSPRKMKKEAIDFVVPAEGVPKVGAHIRSSLSPA